MCLYEYENIFIGKAIGLPPAFLALEEGSKGGGVIEVRNIIIIKCKDFRMPPSVKLNALKIQ